MEQNVVKLCGKIIGEFECSHIAHGYEYQKSFIEIKRLSGTSDIIPVVIKKSGYNKVFENKKVELIGRFRSIDKKIDGYNRTISYVLIDRIEIVNADIIDYNEIEFSGTICKSNDVRYTRNKWVICDFVVANNNLSNSYYFHCISWGFNALKVADLKIGHQVNIIGRVQSREYTKNNERKVVYEISVNNIEF